MKKHDNEVSFTPEVISKQFENIDAKVYLTYVCRSADCKFCMTDVRPHTEEVGKGIFLDRFRTAIENYYINGGTKILLTGGEPTETPYKLLESLEIIQDYPFKLVALYTNGTRLLDEVTVNGEKIRLLEALKSKGLENINLSIHHYDREKRKEVSGREMGDLDAEHLISEILKAGFSLRLNCTLMKDFIGEQIGKFFTPKEVMNYIDWATGLGVRDIYFRDLFRIDNRSEYTTPGDISKLLFSDEQRIHFDKVVLLLITDRFLIKCIEKRHGGKGDTNQFIDKVTGAQITFGQLEIGNEDPEKYTYFTVNPDGSVTRNMNRSQFSIDLTREEIRLRINKKE